MFIDARTLTENETIETEVCIVGAGEQASPWLANLSVSPFTSVYWKAEALNRTERHSHFTRGENIGLPYFPLDESRLRYFGGTTGYWTGSCRPLDEIDFQARDWIPHSGWSFNKSHLDPFYERAHRICQLGPYTNDTEAWETETTPSFRFSSDRLILIPHLQSLLLL